MPPPDNRQRPARGGPGVAATDRQKVETTVSPAVDNAEQTDLFEFLRLVALTFGRGKLTRMQAAVAILTALDSEKTTGTGVVVNVDTTAVELGISERRVWVHFKALVEAGWFEQTVKPAKAHSGSRGRRARYRCLRPPLDLGLLTDRLPDSDLEASDETEPDRVHDARLEPSDETAEQRVMGSHSEPSHDEPIPHPTSDGFGDQRLTVSEPASDGSERGNGTLPTSVGPTADGSTSPVVAQLPKPQDAREDSKAEQDRQLAELEAWMADNPEPDPDPPPDDEAWDHLEREASA